MEKSFCIDMDNVLVDFPSAFEYLNEDALKKYEGKLDEVPGIFALMKPVDGAMEAFKKLSQKCDAYILSTSTWNNPTAWSDKLEWVKKYLEYVIYKRLILTHHKNLNKGDYLIDDRTKKGQEILRESLFYLELINFKTGKAF